MKKKILLVEDDRKMLDVMRRYLENCGFSVLFTDNGSEALMFVRDSKPDLVVADVGLPGLDGFAMCKAIKSSSESASMPVIIISGGKTGEADIVEGYGKGADDYLTKPFAFSVLAAKINAVLRRFGAVSGPAAKKIKEQGLVLDPSGRTVKVAGKPVVLTRKEFDLLTLLLEKKGRVLGVPYILETVWGYDMTTYDNPHTVETHISSLRKKLGAKLGARFVSMTGYGYKFE
ncbi:MAG: DNA-binding response regulator [Elusimicrobia bacterium CG08_land_8_20_14_0_20_51_18]|nr:MAG: DNA-binding response regulator [Elusimicrobia bacterium CG08_land_8_20_14_0_20_51_18]